LNDAGNVALELRTPFAYLRGLTDEIRTVKKQRKRGKVKKKTDGNDTVSSPGACSNQLQSCGKSRSQSEHFSSNSPLDCIAQIEFPQRTGVVRFIDPNRLLAVR
jgi:hypothetical protein